MNKLNILKTILYVIRKVRKVSSLCSNICKRKEFIHCNEYPKQLC